MLTVGQGRPSSRVHDCFLFYRTLTYTVLVRVEDKPKEKEREEGGGRGENGIAMILEPLISLKSTSNK